MTLSEWRAEVDHIRGLWPAWSPTEQQLYAGYEGLRRYAAQDVQAVADDVYARQDRPTRDAPIGAIREALKRRAVTEATRGPDLDSNYILRVQADEAEMAEALRDWTDEDFEHAKAEILEHEPALRPFARLRATSRWWIYFAFTRFALRHVSTKIYGQWRLVPVDQYWQTQARHAPATAPLTDALVGAV